MHVQSAVPDKDHYVITDYTMAMSNVACAADAIKPLRKPKTEIRFFLQLFIFGIYPIWISLL